jgi:hypothetical protein
MCALYVNVQVVVFMGVLGAMLVLITWQIKWAADHGSSNYTRGKLEDKYYIIWIDGRIRLSTLWL